MSYASYSSYTHIALILTLYASMLIATTIQYDYPKNKNITKGERYPTPRSVDIETKSELESYIMNYDYVIAVFHMDWCGHCRHFLPILDEASTYHIAKKFQFLKINCNLKEICNAFKADRFPTIKVYHRGNELRIEPIRELEPLLEFIDKLTSNPIIEVKSIEKFYEDYGTFSPLIIYNSNNTKFVSCINMLAKSDFSNTFYFGQYKASKPHDKEQVIFDFNSNPIKYDWNDNCDEIKLFLNDNKFPLIHQIEPNALKKIQRSGKIAAVLFVDANDKSQMNFVNKDYTQISYRHRNIVFGYVDMNTDKGLATHLKIEFKQKPRLLLYDFTYHKYYIEEREFNMEKRDEEYVYIERIVDDVRKLPFTTGSKLDDILMKFGIDRNSNMFAFVIVGGIVGIAVLLIALIFICDKPNVEVTPEMIKKKEQ